MSDKRAEFFKNQNIVFSETINEPEKTIFEVINEMEPDETLSVEFVVTKQNKEITTKIEHVVDFKYNILSVVLRDLIKDIREVVNHPPLCPHQLPHHECNDCMIESDIAYDQDRERRSF